MKWAFQIERTALDRQNLSDLLDSIGYRPVDVPGLDPVFSSETLEACVNADEVWEELKRIRDWISKVTEIDPEFTLGPVIDLSSGEPKRHHFLEIKSGLMVTTSLDAVLTVSPPDNLSEEELAEWNRLRVEQEYREKLEAQKAKLIPASREPRAVKLLQLLKRNQHTGESLYKIYELAEGHPSHRKEFQERFGILLMGSLNSLRFHAA